MNKRWEEAVAVTNPGKTVIAKMQAADLAEVQSIERESQLSSWSIEGYENELNNQESVCLVAKVENKIIGFIIARLIMSSNCAEIYNIAVKPQFRRIKAGSDLLQTLYKICVFNNLDEIFLEVRKSNTPAIEFYKKQRFGINYTRKNFYTNPVEDAYVMSKKIN